MENPKVSRIRIYPVKSLDPVEVQEATIGIRSLKHDRAFAMLASDGRFVNGKRTGQVYQLQASYDIPNQLISLTPRKGGVTQTFELREGNPLLNNFLSDFFEVNLSVLHRTRGELMDIPGASSVTIVSENSLVSLQQKLEDFSIENLRLRFRSNIELSGIPAFWEEQLFQRPGMGMSFRVGEVEMIGISPRARCNVPPRHPLTGETNKDFVKNMIERRNNSLPKDSTLPLFGRNTYYLTVNTYLPESEEGKMIRVGDRVEILEPVPLNKL